MKNIYKMLIVLLFVAGSDLWAIKLPDGTQAEISTFEKHANKKFSVNEYYDDEVIAGLCVEDKSLVTFYPDGKIESITTQLGKTLEDAHLINTKYGALVIFGKVSYSWHAYKDYEYTITLYNSGKLKTTMLGTKPIFVEIPELDKLEITETLELWENGNVKRISFPKKRTFEVGDEIFSCEA